MKTALAALAAVAFLGLSVPANAGVTVSTDNPDVPNCTVLGPNTADCENVLTFVNGFATDNGSASCPCPWEVFSHEHCVKV